MPEWWAVLSAIFMLAALAAMVALTAVLLRVLALLREIQPKLSESVARVDEASKKVSQAAESLKCTADHVGSKVRGVADALEALALVNAKRFQTLTTLLTATSTVFKLIQMVKNNKIAKKGVDKRALNKDNKDVKRGVEQSGSSSGS